MTSTTHTAARRTPTPQPGVDFDPALQDLSLDELDRHLADLEAVRAYKGRAACRLVAEEEAAAGAYNALAIFYDLDGLMPPEGIEAVANEAWIRAAQR